VKTGFLSPLRRDLDGKLVGMMKKIKAIDSQRVEYAETLCDDIGWEATVLEPEELYQVHKNISNAVKLLDEVDDEKASEQIEKTIGILEGMVGGSVDGESRESTSS
jgi:hypothetical protein